MLSVYMIGMISVCAVGLIYIIGRAVISAVKARKAGIVRTVFPESAARLILLAAAVALFAALAVYFGFEAKPYRDFLNDLNARGTAPLAEYYGVTTDEFGSGVSEEQRPLLLSNAKSYCGHVIQDYTDKMTLAVVFAVISASLITVCGAFITKDGKVYFMQGNLVRGISYNTFACVKGKKICFYDEDEPEKLLLNLHATTDNLELCRDFIRPAGADNTEPAKQN